VDTSQPLGSGWRCQTQKKQSAGTSSATPPRVRRVFTAELKADAVRMLEERRASGVSVAQIARALGVGAQQLQDWAKGLGVTRGTDTGGAPWETLEQENRRLRREIETLRLEQAFAKKVEVYFAKELR
jgi:transposase